jgi:hypothetical protein
MYEAHESRRNVKLRLLVILMEKLWSFAEKSVNEWLSSENSIIFTDGILI